jgi:hypothetical protein
VKSIDGLSVGQFAELRFCHFASSCLSAQARSREGCKAQDYNNHANMRRFDGHGSGQYHKVKSLFAGSFKTGVA